MKSKRMASLLVSLILAAAVSCTTVFAADWNKMTLLGSEQTEIDSMINTADDETVSFDYSYYTTKAAASKSKVTKTYTAPEGEIIRLSDLALPILKEGSTVTAGWATVKTENVYETQADAEKAEGFVQPNEDITHALAQGGAVYTLYPVFRNKTEDELAAEAAEEAKAEKVAKDGDGNEISVSKVNVGVKALSGDEVSNALKASGADAATSALYDITVTDDSGRKVTVLDGKAITVTLERPKLDGNVSFKLYHIQGDKAEEVPITVNGDSIIFSASEFSPYVLTWKISSGISRAGNPATGDDFNVVPFIIIAGVALAAVVALLVIKKVKGGKDEEE